ncbi:MAG: CCA tRNA nucleotidyltransferase [Tissierellia bacterium]|jgi:tRNA nucleotidyltransferase (CCA-adding enzyme)|nr:CCA tRNA nucleotidyltransferase [Tissierellia bacterium]
MNKLFISKSGKFVLNRLEEYGEEGFLVGGCVRDSLMGNTPSDFDVTTSAKPDRIMEIFSDKKLITLGKKYGTIGIMVDGEIIETTTYRKDGDYLDGRHPENVEFSKDLIQDLKRRDFTINAMAMDVRGNIIDEFGGISDLESGIIRTVGIPEERFEEDKLRMLRGVRFANRFNFQIEDETYLAIRKFAKNITQVAPERIQMELNQIFLSETPGNGINLLYDTNLMAYIFPELMDTIGYDQMSPYHHKNLFFHMLCTLDNVPRKLHLRIAGLFHDIAKVNTLTIDEEGIGHFYGHDKLGADMVVKILKRLRYDSKTINAVKILIDQHMKASPEMGKKGLKRQIKRVGKDLILDLYDLMIADMLCTRDDRDISFLENRKIEIKNILDTKEVIDKSGLEINGRDLIEIGYNEGKIIGKMLDYLTELVLDDENLNKKEILLNIAREKLSEEK